MFHTDHAYLYDGNFSPEQNSAKIEQILREIIITNNRSVEQKQQENEPKCTLFYWVIVSVTVWLYNTTCTVFLAANCVRSRGRTKRRGEHRARRELRG